MLLLKLHTPSLKFKIHKTKPKFLNCPKMSSWPCSKCTFLNSSQTLVCKICLSPSPSSSSSNNNNNWSCNACTFSNPNSNSQCEICGGARSRIDLVDLEPEELADPSVGPVFLPLRKCGAKRKADASEGKEVVQVEDDVSTVVSGGVDSASNNTMLKILSYNVWFREDLEVHKRMKALGDLIQLYSPELICFQEVTPYIYEIFQCSNWWKMYQCSLSREMASARPYFCMQMSKLTVKSFKRKPFDNSIMGRELCITEVDFGSNKKLVVATSHFESPSPAPPRWDQMYSKERVTQAKETIGFLNDFPNVIFGGDMNWDDKLDGNFPLSDGWVDVWNELKNGENGWTYDTKSNQMLSGNRTLQKRLDRFVCNLKDFKIHSIEMIGKEAIPGLSYIKEKKVRGEVKKLELPVLPSDHYGLLLTIQSI